MRYLCFAADGTLRYTTTEARLATRADGGGGHVVEVDADAFDPVRQTARRDPATGRLEVADRPSKPQPNVSSPVIRT